MAAVSASRFETGMESLLRLNDRAMPAARITLTGTAVRRPKGRC